jgi:hypothetical protein
MTYRFKRVWAKDGGLLSGRFSPLNGQLNQIIITVNQIDAWHELNRGRKVAVGRGMEFRRIAR